jgi:DNA-binding response OmpR family regulator
MYTPYEPIHSRDGMWMKASVHSKQPHGEYRILYVEDDGPSRSLLSRASQHRKGWKLYLASTLEQAREQLAFRPHVILLDIHLPDGSGYDFLAYLDSRLEYADIPVIAVSANAMQEDISRGIDAGLYRYLTKPLDLGVLFSLIDELYRSELS